MKIPTHFGDNRWRYLAFILDGRLPLVLLFVAIFFFPLHAFVQFSSLDKHLFGLGILLQGESVDANDFVRVDVPPDEMQRLLHDPASANDFMAFLSQLQQTYTTGSALVLREKLWTDYSAHQFVMTHAHTINASLSPDIAQSLSSLNGSMRSFLSAVTDNHLVRTRIQPVPAGSGALLGIRHALMPVGSATGLTVFPVDDLTVESPQLEVGSLERFLLWQTGQGIRPDASLSLFLIRQQMSNPEWLPGQGIRLGEHLVRTSANAGIYPLYSVDSGHFPSVTHYGLAQLSGQDTRRILHQKTVVIGETGDAAVDDLLYSVMSLESGNYAIFLPGFIWLHIAVMLVTLVYLLLFPYWRLKVSGVVSLILVFAMLLGQQTVLIWQREWFPVSQWLFFLIVGHGLMLGWCLRRQFFPSGDVSMQETVMLTATGLQGIGTKTAGTKTAGFFNRRKKEPLVKITPTMGHVPAADRLDERDTAKPPLLTSVADRNNARRQFIGRFQIQRELGRGAMGVVYLGFDPNISRQVAIKTLHYNQFESADLRGVKERFQREARAAGMLRHPNIVTIYESGEEEDLAYMVMDYIDGKSLASYVAKESLLDIERVYLIMAYVADAVDYAHGKGIVHRDIKPSNILFDEKTHEVKVADFGIARIMDGSATRTKTGDILGSPLYMSPEQLKGEAISGQSDIFSLGVTFYQLLTGELPFKGDNLANLSYQIVQCKFRPVDEIRPELPDSARKIINKAMQKNPDNRFHSAGEMVDAINRALSRDFV